MRTTDGGSTWSPTTSYGVPFSGVDITAPTTGYAVGDQGYVIRTADAFASYNLSKISNNNLNDVYFVNQSTGWTVGNAGEVYKTTSGGTTWSQQPTGTSETLNAVKFVDASTGWAVGENGTILKTTTGGN